MGVGKALLLFLVGMFLAFIVFPVAFFVSAGLGYIIGLVALGMGVYLIARREGRILPLVLGIILCVLSFLALAGTAAVHIGAYVLSETAKEVTKTKSVTAVLGQPVAVDRWQIVVEGVEEAAVVKSSEGYYRAKPGYKIVVVRLRVVNLANDIRSLADFHDFLLVTSTGKSYERVYPVGLVWVWEPTAREKQAAVNVDLLDTLADVAPGASVEGDLLFQIPVGEKPQKLVFKVGFIGGHIVTIKLTSS